MNALLLGPLPYRSRWVPQIIPLVGLIGAPLLVASDIATVFGLKEQVSGLSAMAVIPIALWEFSLGVYLVVKGFKPSPLTAGMAAPGPVRPATGSSPVRAARNGNHSDLILRDMSPECPGEGLSS